MTATIESFVSTARRAALLGGVTRVVRMHFRVGPETVISARDLAEQLHARFQGPLLEGCQVTWEGAAAGGVTLMSIEGYVPEP